MGIQAVVKFILQKLQPLSLLYCLINKLLKGCIAVSYTHLDVYKRQVLDILCIDNMQEPSYGMGWNVSNVVVVPRQDLFLQA